MKVNDSSCPRNVIMSIGDIRKMINREKYGVMEKTLTITDLIVDKLEELENRLVYLEREETKRQKREISFS